MYAGLAQFVAQHAVALLLAVTAALFLLTALLWLAIERWMPRVFARFRGLWSRFDSRGLAARYLGVHAAASFIVAGLGLAAFLELADEIGVDEQLAQFDAALATALGRTLDLATLHAFALLTHLGDPMLLVPLACAIAVLLFVRREPLLAWGWIIATGGGALLNTGIKLLFGRDRPDFRHELARAEGYSFPSGHAAGSMLVYGLLAYLVVRHTARVWHIPSVALALLLIVFVGASRVLLQVHYFSDVLAGWSLAATWIALCVAGLEAIRLGARRRQ